MQIRYADTEYLFWTKVPDRSGNLVKVKVFVDLNECLVVARGAPWNSDGKAKLGAISAELYDLEPVPF